MKRTFVLLCFMCVSHVIHGKFSPEEQAMINQFISDCIASTGVDVTILQNTRKGEFPNDPKFMEWAFCLAKKAGYLLEDGSYNYAVMKAMTDKAHGEGKGDLLVNKCGNESFGVGPVNVLHLAKCFYGYTQISLY